MKAGVIGLGDMGSGLAKNLIANGFETAGLDLSPDRLAAFRDMGGQAKESVSPVARTTSRAPHAFLGLVERWLGVPSQELCLYPPPTAWEQAGAGEEVGEHLLLAAV